MEFKSHADKDGFLRGRNVLVHGPIEPGTLVTWLPRVDGIWPRWGTIVGVHSGQVDVMWNAWVRTGRETYDDVHRRIRALAHWAADNGLVVITARQRRSGSRESVRRPGLEW